MIFRAVNLTVSCPLPAPYPVYFLLNHGLLDHINDFLPIFGFTSGHHPALGLLQYGLGLFRAILIFRARARAGAGAGLGLG